MATIETKIYTPADLLKMPDSNNIELVNGELVEKPVSALSALVEATVSGKLFAFCDAHKTAVVLSSITILATDFFLTKIFLSLPWGIN